MVGVRGEQRDVGGRGTISIADRHMEFVGGDDAESGVAKLPPELVANSGDADCVCRGNGVLDRLNDAGSGEKENQNNKNGDYGPRQFYLITTVDLGRLEVIRRRTVAKFHDCVGQEGKDHEENQASNDENENREPMNGISGSRFTFENVGDRRGGLHQSKGRARTRE